MQMATRSAERDSAVRRLNAALAEHDRSADSYDAAIGTSSELGAWVRLCGAREHVTARDAWLSWIDDDGYRGLHAGPFLLRTENLRTEPVRPPDPSVRR
jgi:hypothetical protein